MNLLHMLTNVIHTFRPRVSRANQASSDKHGNRLIWQRIGVAVLAVVVLMTVLIAKPGRARGNSANGEAASLSGLLNADGTLNLKGMQGGFSAAGYRMELMPNGSPRFIPGSSAQAQTNCWDTQFTLPNGTNGSVTAIAVIGSDIYVGGSFTVVGNTLANNIAKFNTSTNIWSGIGSGSGNGVNGSVDALVASGGDLFVGGFFTTANVGGSLVFPNNIAKFNTNTNTWSTLGSGSGNGVDNSVSALILNGNDLYVGGRFTAANIGGTTVAANRVAKFNTSINIWSALGSGGGNGVGAANSSVSDLVMIGSDLFVGGGFTTANVGGTTVSASGVAKFDTSTNTWSALGSVSGNGVVGTAYSLAASGSDLFIGGNFITAKVGGTTIPMNYVAKFNTNTNTWSTLGSGGGNGVNNSVFALAVSGSDLFVGGAFTTANIGGTTVSTNRVAKFNISTNSWSALGSGSGNGVNDAVYALTVAGSNMYIGGFFTAANIGGIATSANSIVKFNTSTSAWNALGLGGGNGVNTLNGVVYALAVSGSDMFIGGSFAAVGGMTVNNVAKFNTLTNAWSAVGWAGGNGVNGVVVTLTVSGSDLYLGGTFTTVNVGGATTSANRIAKFNTGTNTWSVLGSNGGNGLSDTVYTLALSGSDVFVGGSFTTANVGGTLVAANRVAKFNTGTATWNSFGSGGGNGANAIVQTLAVSGSDLYVGGTFTTVNVGGVTVSANRIARYNTSTNTWSALGSGGGNGVNNSISALVLNGSDLFVCGVFDSANVGATVVSVNNVAKFNTSTSTWSALGSGGGNGVNGFVFTLRVNGSDLYLGGIFTTANVGGTTVSANRIVKYNLSTNNWSALGAGDGNGTDNEVRALAVNGGDLFVGGFFSSVNVGGVPLPTNRVARYNLNASTWSALGPSSGNGVSGSYSNVLALAVSGSDVYVGGYFKAVGNMPANNVAKFDTNTNTWSVLGSGGGNGVNDQVYALAVSGNNLYVGGMMNTANVGGVTVAANNIASYNLSTNTWNALGSGGGNGVSGSVYTLAISGSDLYAGGAFILANVGGTTVTVNRVARYATATNTWSKLGSGSGSGVGGASINTAVYALTVNGRALSKT